MEGFVEWTFEGGPKGNHLVGVTGNRARYQFGMYDIVRERVDNSVNLSGTAIIRFYYRLKHFA